MSDRLKYRQIQRAQFRGVKRKFWKDYGETLGMKDGQTYPLYIAPSSPVIKFTDVWGGNVVKRLILEMRKQMWKDSLKEMLDPFQKRI